MVLRTLPVHVSCAAENSQFNSIVARSPHSESSGNVVSGAQTATATGFFQSPAFDPKSEHFCFISPKGHLHWR